MADFFDVAIVGGGFSGLALAREAAVNGFKTVLVEAQALGQGTSANSLRIVHGGFRYLQTGSIGRVLQSAQAQRSALKNFPELIDPLPCLMPLQGNGLRSKYPARFALAIYHLLAAIPADRRGTVISKEEVEAESSCLKDAAPHGALKWWDALVRDPAGLIDRLRAEATEMGAEIRTATKAKAVRIGGKSAELTVENAAGSFEITSRVIINAAGPAIGALDVPGAERSSVQWCRSFNLVFKQQLDPRFAIAGQGRGRLLFAVPRGSGTAIGTWYLCPHRDSALAADEVSEGEIASALDDIKAAYPRFSAERSDLIAVESGVLPSVSSSCGEPVPLGNERLIVSGRYAEIVSTKFTTFEVQAARILRTLARLLQ